jgi:putative hydrolase of the HAD superfamily
MFGHVRLICFDLDDTLWPCRPVIEAAEAECYAWLERQAPRLTARYGPGELRAHRLALGRGQPEIAHDLTEVRLRSLAEMLQAAGYETAAAWRLARAASDVFRAARNRVTPYDDVPDALARLRERYTLVSVTNGNSQIERTPLHASFDLSLTAAEVGAAKPDPAIFRAASARSGVALQAFLHVGDDPLRDVQAARDLGLTTVWVNRAGHDWPEGLPRPDLEIAALPELVTRLAG